MKKGHWILFAAGVIILIAAAILWVRLFIDGVTLRGAAIATLFTALGVLWLVINSRRTR